MSFRILSLDGGGIRGVITARILQQVEQEIINQGKGESLKDYFDLIAGTSTGSILAAGIILGKKSDELINLYLHQGKEIFPKKNQWEKLTGQITSAFGLLSKPKYTHDGLIKILQKPEILGNTRIKDIQKPMLLILAYDTLYRNTTFFTNFHPDFPHRWYDDCYLWQICTASASAPTFFPPHELKPVDTETIGNWEFPHVDGGISANTPALAAIALINRINRSSLVSEEIKREYKLDKVKLEDISILSIGTGQTTKPYSYEQIRNWKGLDWINNIPSMFIDPNAEVTNTICRELMGGFESKTYLRLQFDLNKKFEAKPEETYKDSRILLNEKKRVNEFTGKKVSESIDDASEEFIQQLIDTTVAFIEKGHSYENRNDKGPPVKEAIKDFIKHN